MSDQITQLFNYLGNQVRVVTIDGAPWFVAADIAAILGLPNITSTLKSKYIKNDERAMKFIGERTANIISESALYKLVLRSKRLEARQFQDWVTGTVLPAIRKDGAYISGEEKVATGEMNEDEFLLKAFSILQGKVERITAERDAALETVAKQDERLNFITVAEYLAMDKRYQSHSHKTKLGQLAKMLCESRGLRTSKAHTTYTDRYGRTHNVVIGQYPREVLEEAEGLLAA